MREKCQWIKSDEIFVIFLEDLLKVFVKIVYILYYCLLYSSKKFVRNVLGC